MQIKKGEILGLATQRVYVRGEKHYSEDRVRIEAAEKDFFSAIVRGHPPSKVAVHRSVNRFVTSCSCAKSAVCEHVVAALLSARDHYAKWPALSGAAKDGNSHETNGDRESSGNWRQFISAVHHSGSPAPVAPSRRERKQAPWHLFFRLTAEYGEWILTPFRARRRKDGRYFSAQPASLREPDNVRMKSSQKETLALMMLDNHTPPAGNGAYGFPYQFLNHTAPAEKLRHRLPYGVPSGMLFDLLRESWLFLVSEHEERPLHVAENTARLEVRLHTDSEAVELRTFLLREQVEIPFSKEIRLLTSNPCWVLIGEEVIKLEGEPPVDFLLSLSQSGEVIRVPHSESAEFLIALEGIKGLAPFLMIVEGGAIPTIDFFAHKRIHLSEHGDVLALQLRFGYAGREFTCLLPGQQGAPAEANETLVVQDATALRCVRIRRNWHAETEAMNVLIASGARQSANGDFILRDHRIIDWLLFDLPQLAAKGFEITGEQELEHYRVKRGAPRLEVVVRTEIDWFDCQMVIEFDGVRLSLKELRKAMMHQTRYVKLVDGSVAVLPEELQKRFSYLVNLGEVSPARLRVSRHHLTLIDALFEKAELAETDREFDESLARLKSFDGIKATTVSSIFRGTLRSYQQRGLDWLHFLQEYRFGGCLADDMGLGKTIQALALLQGERDRGVEQPTLIVCPTSVLFNWEKEIQQFTPKLNVLVHSGPERRRTRKFAGSDLVLCSYGILRRDIEFLKDVEFHYVILDESQHIKNPLSQTAKAARLLQAKHRLVLTGTPVENNTQELWSQINFLNPGLLGSLRYFKQAFAKPVERERDQATANLLRKMIFPFVLRRTKGEVAPDLPAKIENLFYCDMLEGQRKFYDKWRDYYRAHVLQHISMDGLERSRMYVLEGLTCLRQICCHPKLIEGGGHLDSGKFEALQEMLLEIIAEGHKILVFSQFVRMLTIIRQFLDKEKVTYAYLDGQTRNRKQVVEKFQTDSSIPIFLISLKAGGFGLNLTAADYVFLFDPWWNPAIESQAIDRTHRIGQDKNVIAYKMIVRDSVEEKILELQRRKKELVDDLITTDSSVFKNLTRDDIEGLFS